MAVHIMKNKRLRLKYLGWGLLIIPVLLIPKDISWRDVQIKTGDKGYLKLRIPNGWKQVLQKPKESLSPQCSDIKPMLTKDQCSIPRRVLPSTPLDLS